MNKRELVSKQYAEKIIEKVIGQSDYQKLTYAIQNAVKKGWDERGEEVEELKKKISALENIILKSMTPSYLKSLMETFKNEDEANLQISILDKQIKNATFHKKGASNRVRNSVLKRNRMTELHKAKLMNEVLNER